MFFISCTRATLLTDSSRREQQLEILSDASLIWVRRNIFSLARRSRGSQVCSLEGSPGP
ncbi:hypothetical protein MPTK1_5g22690 [Marchantia polymorpha subsp. ruderalis]|uniref:Uncharacterized protein n=2 Tax=Marchantia polymorpha TaxID=3197 RepID=A0AAF6BL78_MARPO|nr:hypothetical protein MARPO_0010s0187 [Marchantia polymorpha]PTQ46817.1 hypothetical protein MARPO_0010s0187 [Marchantia polymorpha]BBN12762.1 hypothetical protein Mp_5g22690 [Marchantia polymorpha subsp. ruderalis]BBN12763.1 hypothetical protein Mp_5g22690 [Marchantia polymorpha subsp. ruderalis]|eukprot:PTQ46816.1 hypothetical protein MARPO_0010s0187 [Marchantia polymorpha]